MTSSEMSEFPPSTTWQQQQQQLTSSSDNITVASVSYLSSIRLAVLIVSILGVLFNGFVLCVLLYGKQTRRTTSNVFIINQTVADFMSCLSVIINAITTMFSRQYMKLSGGIVICILFEASCLISICSTASIFSLILLTMERYFKIVHPIKYRQKWRPWMNWVGVALPWADAVLIGVPLIASTSRYDDAKDVCRALVYYVSPAAQKVRISISLQLINRWS